MKDIDYIPRHYDIRNYKYFENMKKALPGRMGDGVSVKGYSNRLYIFRARITPGRFGEELENLQTVSQLAGNDNESDYEREQRVLRERRYKKSWPGLSLQYELF